MLSPFPLMCWKQQLFFFFFNGRKNGCKGHFWSAQTWQRPSDLFITLQHWLCWKNATQTVHLWQKNISRLLKKKKRNKKNNNMECVGTSQSFCMNAIVKWKSLWRWNYKNKRTQRCGSIVPASEISLVTLLFHYIPLCHHSEWLVLIMQMSQRKEAWVIITVVDRLWGKMLPLP